jgi:actin-related protein 10
MIRRNSIYGTEDRIVLQVGSKYTLLGFSNEVKPRIIVPSLSLDLPSLFSTHLQTDPKTRRVIIVESIDMPLALKQSLARVLFGPRLQVLSISFINSDVLALVSYSDHSYISSFRQLLGKELGWWLI